MFLVVNETTDLHKYYETLKFKKVESWNVVRKEVLECTELESTDTTELGALRIIELMKPQEHSTQQLILRTYKNIPRMMKEDDAPTSPAIYNNKMKNILTEYVQVPLKPDIYFNNQAEGVFNCLFPSRTRYEPDGIEWQAFHMYWSGKTMMH